MKMDRLNYLRSLDECPTADCDCPYWDWETHKCKMYYETNSHPVDECDAYFGYDE